MVLDEAQNATTMQMKMFLTRLGEGSRMAVTGDTTQIDLPRGVTSGLVEAERVLRDVPGVGFSRFTAEDVVRHPLVARIIRAYENAHPRGCLSLVEAVVEDPRWEAAGIAAIAERAARAALTAAGATRRGTRSRCLPATTRGSRR